MKKIIELEISLLNRKIITIIKDELFEKDIKYEIDERRGLFTHTYTIRMDGKQEEIEKIVAELKLALMLL